jgi:hypothetical protein
MARNVIAPEKKLTAVAEVFNEAAWTYKESIARLRLALPRWRKASLEVCRELYYAKKILTAQAGQYKDPAADDYIEYTWNGYCGELGISPRASSRLARLYVPADESETGAELFLEAPQRPALPAPYTETEKEQRIGLVMNGGPRPSDWTREEERIVTDRLDSKRYEELAAIYIEKKHSPPRQDYLKSILSKTKALKQFRLKTGDQMRTQFAMFDAIDRYLRLFPDKELRLAAAANLISQIHDAANYLIERDLILERGGAEG